MNKHLSIPKSVWLWGLEDVVHRVLGGPWIDPELGNHHWPMGFETGRAHWELTPAKKWSVQWSTPLHSSVFLNSNDIFCHFRSLLFNFDLQFTSNIVTAWAALLVEIVVIQHGHCIVCSLCCWPWRGCFVISSTWPPCILQLVLLAFREMFLWCLRAAQRAVPSQ